jgi:Protein of unknown function (DUF3108)
MMKGFAVALVIVGFSLSGWAQQSNAQPAHNEVFKLGEELTYKASFLGITAGNATTLVNKSYHKILGNPCYKIDVFGETSSWLSWITRVKDLWVTYMDTTSLATRATYRKIREGNYRKDEWVTYLQEKKAASVQVMDKETEKYGDPTMYDIPTNATDIVGGFMHLRFFDLDHSKKGDTLAIRGFFEDASYTLKILYMGRDVLKTKFGKIPCHLLVPVMPDNKMFDGENSISVWISADKNKIPIRMSAKMFIGSTGVELIGFRGLKHSIKILVD